MPDPVPVVIIGRLAVHKDFRGKRSDGAASRRRIGRTLQAAKICRNRAILVTRFQSERGGSMKSADSSLPRWTQ